MMIIISAFEYLQIHKLYRSTGASMAKAQAEFTTGVMKNETVRQAAGMNFCLFYMYFSNTCH